MKRDILENLIEEGKSQREISRELNTSQTNLRYWLNKYGIKTRGCLRLNPHKCACGETNPAKFYGNKRSICGPCHNRYTLKQGQLKKARVRDYLGGKCINCGYNKYASPLVIHHTNPERKDPDFVGMRGWAWARIVEEVKDCVLLCANCHIAFHSGEIRLLREVG